MGTQTDSAGATPGKVGPATRAVFLLTLLAWGTALGVRVWAGQGLPLWMDETWTAMIAGQPDWTRFWREAWLDVNPPLYYAVMRVWTMAAGTSDVALRLPSALFVLAAAALPLFQRRSGLTRTSALCLSALLILWRPGFDISLDARGYGLLLLLSVAQMFAFARLLGQPDRRSAALWAGCASAAIVTHYFALVPGAVQGMMLIWKCRGRVLHLWPAALPFVPAFAWLAIHAPRLADYARPDIAWYEPVTPKLAAGFLQYLVGPPGWWQLGLIGGAIVLTAALSFGRTHKAAPATRALEATAVAGLIALTLLLAIAVLRSTLTDRYLVPIVPSVLLALVLVMQRFQKAALGQALLILVFLVPMASAQDLRDWLKEKTFYGFEEGAHFVMPYKVARLTFVWDHPAARILDASSLARLGSFFFNRAGQNVTTSAVILKPGEDGNRVLQQKAQGSAIIWIYNRARATAARSHPPDAARWSGWTCQHQRGPWVGILACVPVAKADGAAKVAP